MVLKMVLKVEDVSSKKLLNGLKHQSKIDKILLLE